MRCCSDGLVGGSRNDQDARSRIASLDLADLADLGTTAWCRSWTILVCAVLYCKKDGSGGITKAGPGLNMVVGGNQS